MCANTIKCAPAISAECMNALADHWIWKGLPVGGRSLETTSLNNERLQKKRGLCSSFLFRHIHWALYGRRCNTVEDWHKVWRESILKMHTRGRTFSGVAPQLWLLTEIWLASNILSLGHQLKTYLFAQAFAEHYCLFAINILVLVTESNVGYLFMMLHCTCCILIIFLMSPALGLLS